MSLSIRRAALIAPAVLAFATLTALAQTTAPTSAPAPGPVWGSHLPMNQGTSTDINTALGSNQALVVLGRTGCPVILIGEELWDLKMQKRTGIAVVHNATRDAIAALSDDGTLLVVGPDRQHYGRLPAADATVWNTKTGDQVSTISSSERDLDIEYLAFAGDQYVLICGRPQGRRTINMEVWDVKTGKCIRRFPCNFSSAHDTTVSPDGRYVAVGDNQRVNLYEVATGRELTSMTPPNANPVNADGITESVGPSSVPFLSLRELAFSSDGSELVAATSVFKPRCTVWDHLGQITSDIQFNPLGFSGSNMRFLQWSPDHSAWLINETWLVDRKAKRAVWTCPTHFGDDPHAIFIDDNHLFVTHQAPSPGGEVVTIPWAAIHKACDRVANPATQAWFKPGQDVSLEITYTHPVREQSESTKQLTTEITHMLAGMNVHVADNQPSVITVNLDEALGDPVPIVQRSTMYNQGDKPTGRQASPCRCIATLTLHARGSDAALFSLSAFGESNFEVMDTFTDASLQKTMIGFVGNRLTTSPFPYFITKDTPPVMLPIGMVAQNEIPKNYLTTPFHTKALIELYNPMDPRRPTAPPPAKKDTTVHL